MRGQADPSVLPHWLHWLRPTTRYYRGTGSACAARLIPASSLSSAMRRRPASSSSIEAPMSPLSLPQSPILCLTPRSISSRFPLRRKSGAHRLEIGPLLLIYLFSEGTYVSTYDVSPHYGPYMDPTGDHKPDSFRRGLTRNNACMSVIRCGRGFFRIVWVCSRRGTKRN